MRRFLLAVVFASLLVPRVVDAKSRKAPKPPKTTICKAGALVFRDEFDGQQLDGWTSTGGEAFIKGRALILDASKGTVHVTTKADAADIVCEVSLGFVQPGRGFAVRMDDDKRRRFAWQMRSDWLGISGGVIPQNAVQPPDLVSRKIAFGAPKRCTIIIERSGPDTVMRIGKLTLCASTKNGPEGKSPLITLGAYAGAVVRVDYVRIWKAEKR